MKKNICRVISLILVCMLFCLCTAQAKILYSNTLYFGNIVIRVTEDAVSIEMTDEATEGAEGFTLPIATDEPRAENETETVDEAVNETPDKPETDEPIEEPSDEPETDEPIEEPSDEPETDEPIEEPSVEPEMDEPIEEQIEEPETDEPTGEPSDEPETDEPTGEPSDEPETDEPSEEPSDEPETDEPTEEPTDEPETDEPTEEPTDEPETDEPTEEPTDEPETDEPETEETETDDNKEKQRKIPITDEELANAMWLQDIVDEFNEGCSIELYVIAKDNRIVLGEPITLVAVLHGYENSEFTLQWQESEDDINWFDLEGEDDYRLTVILDRTNNGHFWRIKVNVTDILLTDEQLEALNETEEPAVAETEAPPQTAQDNEVNED